MQLKPRCCKIVDFPLANILGRAVARWISASCVGLGSFPELTIAVVSCQL